MALPIASPPTPPPTPVDYRYLPTPFLSWNRMEGRPRKENFSNSLKAKVHDAMWFLGRQWQMGEFTGQDTGSGILSRVQMEYRKMVGIGPYGQPSQAKPYNGDIPMEAMVESIPYNWSIKERIAIGKKWMFFLRKYSADSYIATFKNPLYNFILQYVKPTTITAPSMSDEQLFAGADIFGGADLSNFLAATTVTDLKIDGIKVFDTLLSGVPLSTIISGFLATPGFTSASTDFIAWVRRTYVLPQFSAQGNWTNGNMEYQFDSYWPHPTTPSSQVRVATKEYHNGHLDWHSFSQDNASYTVAGLPAGTPVLQNEQRLITQCSFPGMPSSRWWQLEDGNVNFCNLEGNNTDIAKIIVTQFQLVYQDDWFVVPFDTEAGSANKINGIVVTDVFGVRTFVANYPVNGYTPGTGAGAGFTEADQQWRSWRWMDISKQSALANGEVPTSTSIVPAIVDDVMESKPLESVVFIRDEVADIVWGVEAIVPDNLGKGKDGFQRSKEFVNFLTGLRPPSTPSLPTDPAAELAYKLANIDLPENWIPFIPVHKTAGNRKIHFQRGAMPRILNGYTPSLIRPRTEIINYGIGAATYQPFYLYEETIPQIGTIVETTIKRTRWYNGKVVMWIGRKKSCGKGSQTSNLFYDKIENIST